VKNIISAFAKPGIWPFSRLAFSDKDFRPSSVMPMEKKFINKRSLFLLLAPLWHKKFLGLAKIAFHQKMCVPSQNLDQDVTEDEERRWSLAF
jgi:hypothetical protein